MKLFFRIGIILVTGLIIGLSFWVFTNLKDRHPRYRADLKTINPLAGALRAGFSAIPVTPGVPDRWTDKNQDAKYDPGSGDTFTDGNGNGVFDPVWIAGFSNRRPANGVHDDIWARSAVLDDGETRLALVVLDAIGFMHDDVVSVRKSIPETAGVDYTVIASTHTHEGPDMMGIWGASPWKSGVDQEYMEFVKEQIVRSVTQAVRNLRPARLEFSEDPTGAAPQVKDTRRPEVFDSGLRMVKAVDREDGSVLGSLVSWGNHPETLWSRNLLISSDFPHFVREGVENGVVLGDSLVKPGIGGVCIYMNGAVGGLMTTHPSWAIQDPLTGEAILEPGFRKAAAQGNTLALLALQAMEQPEAKIDSAGISLIVRTIYLPLKNNLFKLAAAIGVMDRGTSGWMKMRSELAVFKMGPVSFVTVPGEIYPEIVNGGVEAPAGGDFDTGPVEVPPLRKLMPGRYKFVAGLANDEIGYIIPKSQWDEKPPFTYERNSSPYGEENSLGPETAPILHRHLKEMLRELPPED